ncbi:FdhF/YdeP family oxidoreductase [Sphingomonas sp. CGMCC 1.13654]|uniref:FdhF/YdeP family oxidoreductase n=1 Tax=Sphingomonas chungangi TaxID=2683589 RepID=A0A838L9H2_9SPHN|nr:FdhF/YdeP family oxidoreductase [Sphingomonas chungangi]MBA2935550.1 FdhF/YdeP family oxidoreductase [Sphingomonas chungangi]MVW54243.1 FdhF/YdeP family oxidoreductase [Sphingomonas chungangi]
MTKQRSDEPEVKPFKGPAGGWGSVRSLADILPREHLGPEAYRELARQNKPDGFMCVSCAWPKPADHHPAEFCEEGAKATAWELTRLRTTPEFFAEHTLAELRGWKDYDLEQHGRLTHPMRYDPGTDKYVAVSWDEAFDEIGRELKRLDPKSVVFYSSGRTSLEASYMYGLMARMFGNQNLPDSSNMCHESTSVGLKAALGVPVGTTQLKDFKETDAIFFFGQNVGSNAPRMLHDLRDCRKRGVEIVTFNPLKERGLERFTDPQNPVEMATLKETAISTQYHQLRAGSDIAAIIGICKFLIDWDDLAKADDDLPVLDHDFIAQHTKGFDEFAAAIRKTEWADIERETGLAREELEASARIYAKAKAVMAIYGMGITQHVKGVESVRMIVNLLLLRGNVGKPGAGPTPVRGHSNVQGQRTVGITEKTELVPVEKLEAQYGFKAPREKGLDTVETCRGVIDGSVRAVVGLGGNFLRAVPETGAMEEAWPRLDVSVQIATKLNRNHLFAGRVTYLLPCLGRIEQDVQASGPQAVSTEDSTSCIHGSRGKAKPASPYLLSEPAIVAGIAKRILDDNPKVDWDGWVADYSTIRDAIEDTYPAIFKDYNKRLFTPGGVWKGNKASERIWETPSKRAEFLTPGEISATGFKDADGRYRLITLRSNDQFNTTIYGYHDRFRGIKGTRDVLLMHETDIAAAGLAEGQIVALESDAGDGVQRRRDGMIVTPYDIPRGCLGAYYPEANVLIPVEHHAEKSHVPAAKSVPVRIRP